MSINIEGVKATDLGIGNLSVKNTVDSGNTMAICYEAINKVSQVRATLGAYQNRLEHTISSLDNTEENLQAAESRIRDTDMAKTMMEHVKNQIIMHAAQSMLSQSNQDSESVLKLLA